MRYADYGCAWTIFAVGFVNMILTEARHSPGVVLDTSLLWIFVAMFNLLRLRNHGDVKGLRIFCIGANVSECMFEVARLKMWGAAPVFPGLIVAIAIFCEAIFSILSSRRPRTETSYSQRKAGLFGLLLACLLGGIVAAISFPRPKQPAVVPEYSNVFAAAPRFDGEFPCVFASVTDGEIVPQVGNCAMPTVHGAPTDRFEADLRYGNFVLRETDLFLDDGFKVPLTRTYCSNEWVDQNPIHAFGRNSNHPYDIAPIGTRNPYTYQMIVLEDADFLYFDRISKGTGYADAVFQHTETSTRFYKATTHWDGHGWTTKLADGSEILFPESYDAKNLAQGAPYEMRDASGNRLELERDPQRNLQEIRTPHGHWIKFIYDDLSRIKHAEDDAGHWAQYAYNADGMLESAILSSGHQRHYDYNRALMTKITDEKGHVLLRNWFVGRRLQKQQFGNGGVYSYSYDWPQDEYLPRRVGVTLPDGTLRQLSVADSVSEYVKNYRGR